MFDVTIVAAITVHGDSAKEYDSYTVSHVYRLDLEGTSQSDISKFMAYVAAYSKVVEASTMTSDTAFK